MKHKKKCLKFNFYLFNVLNCFQNKSMPLIDLQKSSNTVALVESFLGEFKPDYESAAEPATQDKPEVKILTDIKKEAVDNLQSTQETLINNISDSISKKHENKVSNRPDTTDVCLPVDKLNETTKESIEEIIMPVKEQPPSSPPPPPPPPPPVKRKVRLSLKIIIISINLINFTFLIMYYSFRYLSTEGVKNHKQQSPKKKMLILESVTLDHRQLYLLILLLLLMKKLLNKL